MPKWRSTLGWIGASTHGFSPPVHVEPRRLGAGGVDRHADRRREFAAQHLRQPPAQVPRTGNRLCVRNAPAMKSAIRAPSSPPMRPASSGPAPGSGRGPSCARNRARDSPPPARRSRPAANCGPAGAPRSARATSRQQTCCRRGHGGARCSPSRRCAGVRRRGPATGSAPRAAACAAPDPARAAAVPRCGPSPPAARAPRRRWPPRRGRPRRYCRRFPGHGRRRDPRSADPGVSATTTAWQLPRTAAFIGHLPGWSR